MRTQRIALVLVVLAVSFLLNTGRAWALCQTNDDCSDKPAPYNQCVNNHCGDASCPAPPPPSPVCIASGGIDDVLSGTHCCSGAAVTGSICCIYSADWGTTWASCSQICV